MKKVVFTAFAALAFAFTMTACSGNNGTTDSAADTTKAAVEQAAPCEHQCAHEADSAMCCKDQAVEGQACEHKCQKAEGQECQKACEHKCQKAEGKECCKKAEGKECCKKAEGKECDHKCQKAEGKECEHKCQK